MWAVLSDVEFWPTWTASITSVRPLSPDRLLVGSRVRIKQPRLPATVWTVSDLVEGERFTWTSTGPGVHTRASHRVVGTARAQTGPVTFNFLWTMAGTPSVTLPLFKGPQGLPIGLQLVARRHGEDLLLATARAVERLLA